MDRETRKANLKKLQLPNTSGGKQRKTRPKSKTAETAKTAKSNYFFTPQKPNRNNEKDLNEETNTSSDALEIKKNTEHVTDPKNILSKPAPRAKRTKLDAFIFKDPENVPDSVKNSRSPLNDHDLVVPKKKIKKAPKLAGSQAKNSKTSRAKKQTTIKSAFFRNEQFFAEIASQHCAADQFDGDDVQLALAISKSEAESKGIREVDDNLDDHNNESESIREKLKKYGFKTAEKKDYNIFAADFLPKRNSRRPKTKWANKFTALTLRNSENQKKKLQENIEKLLNSQFRTKPLSKDAYLLPHYKLQSTLLKESRISKNKEILETAENVNRPNNLYFVKDIFEINELPAGHLLKDWNAIQGRDLTPNQKTKISADRLKILENIYQELEEYFSSRKRLDWTINNDKQEDQSVIIETISNPEKLTKTSPVVVEENLKSLKAKEKVENKELDEMINLIEALPANEAANTSNNKILQLLPATKSLETMHVSSCTINTEVTVNTSQNNRSNSPDLFADSDVEMEDADKTNDQEEKTKVKTMTEIVKDKSRNSSLDEKAEDCVIIYEIFSSDEVKNTLLLEQNDPAKKERSPNNLPLTNNNTVIDLTQDDLEFSLHNQSKAHLNHSKTIEEIDLFAESPTTTQDEAPDTSDVNCSSQLSKYIEKNKEDTFKFTLSLETSDNETEIIGNQKEKSFKLETSLQAQEQLKTFFDSKENGNDVVVLQDIAMDHTDATFINFQGSKPLEKSFHKKTTTEKFLSAKNNESKEESFKLTLSMEIDDNDIITVGKKPDESLNLSQSLRTQKQYKPFSSSQDIEDGDIVLQEIALDQTNSSFLNFRGSKQLETSFHKKTATERSLNLKIQEQLQKFYATKEEDKDIVLRKSSMDQTNSTFSNCYGINKLEKIYLKETASNEEIFKECLSGNDTIFRELCTTFLRNEPTNNHSASNEQKNTDFTKSFSEILPSIQIQQQCDNIKNFTMDSDLAGDSNIHLKRKSMSFNAKTPLKENRKDIQTILSKSQSFNNNHLEDSIDLTQNDEYDDNVEPADEDEDDCLILSDDEINYSIWQANKTENFQTSKQSNDEEDVISIHDNEAVREKGNLAFSKDDIIDFSIRKDANKEYSFLDLKDKEKSLVKCTSNDSFFEQQNNKEYSFEHAKDKKNSLIKIALEAETSYSNFEVLTSKYTTSNSPPSTQELNFDRSEFGILEEYSEPIEFTPNLCTPTKVLAEASFLTSPTETTAPMKRYSNFPKSSQKFANLLNNVHEKSATYVIDDSNDYEEFGRLAYTSPLKSTDANKKPKGIEQLLTAEISFKESSKSPGKTKTTTSKTTATKTPTKLLNTTTQEIKCNNKTYTLRYTSSPKPDYTKYTEPELLKALYNFGIKPLTRKQAVKMLEYIYNQTHPVLMEEEEIIDEKQQKDVLTLEDYERPCTSKEALESQSTKKKPRESIVNIPQESNKEVVVNLLDDGNKKLNLQDSCGMEMLRYSIDLKAELNDENYILQTNVTKKTPQPLLPFHIAWYNLVCSNRKLHETILMYEPIDLQEIFLFLKSIGYRYDPKDLKVFFDRRCIIFRYDLTSAAGSNGGNRHVRKTKKTKIAKK